MFKSQRVLTGIFYVNKITAELQFLFTEQVY